ncbi:unnamed protein product [Leptosia nina]|uniref:Uncharacterized protein n=1 Tax=Leptosia nina TaxID=320188 RepID=A0AAV1JBD9_9NEOP
MALESKIVGTGTECRDPRLEGRGSRVNAFEGCECRVSHVECRVSRLIAFNTVNSCKSAAARPYCTRVAQENAASYRTSELLKERGLTKRNNLTMD